MIISIDDAATTRKTVYFVLTNDCANEDTLEGELGYIYRAILCWNSQGHLGFYTYPYALVENNQWKMVGRPIFNMYDATYYTTLEEAVNELFPGE